MYNLLIELKLSSFSCAKKNRRVWPSNGKLNVKLYLFECGDKLWIISADAVSNSPGNLITVKGTSQCHYVKWCFPADCR